MKSDDWLGIGLASVTFTMICLYLLTPLLVGRAPGWFEPATLSFELVKGLPAAFCCVGYWRHCCQYRVAASGRCARQAQA
jgi:hypothetical protein